MRSRHLIIQRLGGGDVVEAQTACLHEALGMAALAGAGTAEDERDDGAKRGAERSCIGIARF